MSWFQAMRISGFYPRLPVTYPRLPGYAAGARDMVSALEQAPGAPQALPLD